MSLKTKLLLLLAGVAGVPLLLFIVLAFANARDSIEQLRIAQLKTLAALKRDKIETFFQERSSDLRTAESYYTIRWNLPILSSRGADRKAPAYRDAVRMLDNQLKAFQREKSYFNVLLVDASGIVRYATADARRYLDRPLSAIAYFPEARQGIYFSDIFRNPRYNDRFEMLAAAPLRDFHKTFIGEIVFEIDMAPIFRFIGDTTGLGKSGEALIAKRDGNAAQFISPLRYAAGAALRKRVAFLDRRAYPAQMAVRGESGAGLAEDYRGTEVLAAWQYIPRLRWGLVTKIDAREAFAPVRRLRMFMILAGLATVLLGVAAALALARALSRPLLALQQGAEAIAAGTLNKRVGTAAQDEVGKLSRAFDAMAEALETKEAEQARTAEALREAEERYRTLAETASDAIVSIDAAGAVVFWNQKAAEVFGFSREDILGRDVTAIMPERFRESHRTGMARMLTTGERRMTEHGTVVSGLKRDGTEFPLELSLSQWKTRQGTFFTAVIRDITERRLAEERIARLNEGLQASVRQLEEANRELEAFSYSVSHDLRAPLRSIAGFGQALAEEHAAVLDAAGRDYLDRILKGARRLDGLVDALLMLSHTSRAELRHETVDLSDLARTVAARLQETEPGRKAVFTIRPGLVAQGDARLLAAVIENLFSNAWKFTARRERTEIAFGVQAVDGMPAFFVRDNGVGFDQTLAGKLFSPFQRLHGEGEYPGTGIGLATVRRIINRHGGRVWIAGVPDAGATVYFTLS